MTPEQVHAHLAQRLGAESAGKLLPLSPAAKDPFVLVAAEHLLEICGLLKNEPELAFDCLMNLGGVDWPRRGKAAVNLIEIVYHLYSYSKRHTFILKVALDRGSPEVPSVWPLWKSAEWLEREQFDLLGVKFSGHPDLRRLLMPDDWIGHPLRKDYEQPQSWHGISTTRESALDGFARADELKRRLAASRAEPAAAAAPSPAAASEPAAGQEKPK
jgi:NADH-quinone oxidoreductase subunit C